MSHSFNLFLFKLVNIKEKSMFLPLDNLMSC